MKKAGWGLLLLLFAACYVHAASPNTLVGTYYYPWYTSSNFHVGGGQATGSTTVGYHLEPTEVQPALGWYDQDHASVISQHYQWAEYAGIDFFVCSYWGIDSSTDRCIRNRMFNNPDRGDIKLCVFLEPRITPADGASVATMTAETNFLCDNYFNKSFYLQVDGKPVIFIYVTRSMSNAELTLCIDTIRDTAALKGYDVYIVGDEVWKGPNTSIDGPRVAQLDGITNYDVYGNNSSTPFVTDAVLNTWQSRNAAWKSLADNYGTDLIPAISPGYNDRTVRPLSYHAACSRKLNNESNEFGTLFTGMIDRLEPGVEMIMINSWNEWHEDTQIEPTTVVAPTNLDDGATFEYTDDDGVIWIFGEGFYTEDVYYEGYGMRYLNILRDWTCSVEGDLNSDCSIDYLDFAELGAGWMTAYDMFDLISIAQGWLGASGAIAYLQLDETVGAVASDSSGNGYDGTLMNMDDSNWVAGKTGNALEFDGVNDYVVVDGVCAEMVWKDLTVSAWMKAAAVNPAQQFMVSINSSDGANSKLLLGTTAGSATLSLGDTAWHHTAATVIDNTWHHIAYVLDDSADTITIYVDGSNVLSFTSTVSIDGSDVFSLGQEYDAGPVSSDFYSGLLDAVSIYDRALSGAEIATLIYYCDDGTCNPGENQCNCPGDCGTPPSTETSCADGIDNDCDGNIDCDDSDCASDYTCNWIQIQYDDFEGGYGNWNDGGSDCTLYTGGVYAHQGNNAVNLQDNTSTSVVTTNNLALSSYYEVKVDFWYQCQSMDSASEDFWLQISTDGGSNFATVEEWNLDDEFVNGQFYSESLIITGYTLTDQTQLRFRCDASANGDDVYIDEVAISAH